MASPSPDDEDKGYDPTTDTYVGGGSTESDTTDWTADYEAYLASAATEKSTTTAEAATTVSSDRLYLIKAGYLGHRSHPDCYLVAGEKATGEFIKYEDHTGIGEYFLNANRFTMDELELGDSFWLTPDHTGVFTADSHTDTEPDSDDDAAVWVPWRHITQHLYQHLETFDIKEAHTFWPQGIEEGDLLGYLVEAINFGGYTSAHGGATIVWKSSGVIKTFFLDTPVDPEDKYTAAQMSDLKDLFEG